MIKSIFFDFDGVLTSHKTGTYTTLTNLEKFTNIPYDRFLSCYKQYKKGLLLGKISFKDIWGSFCQCVGRKINIDILKKAFLNTPKNKKMFDLAENLKKRYKIGIITNNDKDRFYLLTNKFKLDKIFDSLTLSADIGEVKPKEKIFKKALNSLKTNPNEAVFIDNKKKNLVVPKKIGIKTIYYNHEKNTITQLINKLNFFGVDL